MRLENHANGRLRITAPCCIQQSRDLRRVVRVIVHHRDLLNGSVHLKTACSSQERTDSLCGVGGRDSQQHSGGDCRGGITRIMDAGNLEFHTLGHSICRGHRGGKVQGKPFNAGAGGLLFRGNPHMRGTP